MDKIDVINKMQDYINHHIDENITMQDLAKVSFYSPWYSYRLFIEYLNLTPSDYIRRLRLSKSALELRDNKAKILDIALKYGYESVDGYQRAFRHEFGMNPNEYAKNSVPICLFIPYKKTKERKEKKIMSNVKNVFITVIEKPERKVIIKRGIKATEYFEYCAEVGCDVWGILKSMKSISGEPVCLWLPKKYQELNTSEYVQGIEVDINYNGVVPSGMDVINLPKSKYIMFQGEKFEEEDFEDAIITLKESILKYDPKILGYKYDLDNPRIQLEPIGERGYIELLPIK